MLCGIDMAGPLFWTNSCLPPKNRMAGSSMRVATARAARLFRRPGPVPAVCDWPDPLLNARDERRAKPGAGRRRRRREAAVAVPPSLSLLRRLWRENVRHHRGRLLSMLVLTLLMAGLTALYPLVIRRALDMFAAHDPRILYQVPALVVMITAAKAAAQYGQTVAVQDLVLLVIRDLQERMFGHLIDADLARIEREAPAQLAARFTTDATAIREAMIRAVNALRRRRHGGRPGRLA